MYFRSRSFGRPFKQLAAIDTRFFSVPSRFELGIASYLHDLVLELGQEEVDDLVLLDGERVQVDLLHALDLASLHQTAQLGDRLPLLLLALAAATATAATTTATTVTTSTVAEATAGSTTSVSHVGLRRKGTWGSFERAFGGGFVGRRDGGLVEVGRWGEVVELSLGKFFLTSAAIRPAKQFSGARRLAGKIA